MTKPFLTAQWRNLAIANYLIDPNLLTPYLPAGTELDLWKERCYVSLVGFMFIDTKLLGWKIPFHRNFEEVNLRFYVKRLENGTWKRGVVFIKEIVPKPALTWVANCIYKEHYQTLAMNHSCDLSKDTLKVEYRWKLDCWQSIKIEAEAQPVTMPAGSEEEFITEHYWGYTRIAANRTNEYEVTHPRWRAHPIRRYSVDVDFARVYGKEFSVLAEPVSVFLAEGSEIAVERTRVISNSQLLQNA